MLQTFFFLILVDKKTSLMRKFNLILISLIIFNLLVENACKKPVSQPQNIACAIAGLPDIKISTEQGDSLFPMCFKLMVKQPIDHQDTSKGFFWQKVYLSHKSFDRPVVLVTEGYYANYNRITELANFINANQIEVEHRYFGESKPDSMIWNKLNLKQATADLNHIRQLFRKIYTKKWVSTGISKGGQTTIAYRYFYPNDVAASVPYVAPLTFAREDARIPVFIAQKTGTKAYRDRIYAFQRYVLKNKALLLPYFKKKAKEKEWTFKDIGGIETAFEYGILEYAFVMWQWGNDCSQIPSKDTNPEKIMKYLVDIDPYSFFSDQDARLLRPYFYQALTEMGIYTYDTKPFADLLMKVKNPNFEFTMENKIPIPYSDTLNKKMAAWLKAKGNNMIYIYGGNDPWFSTSVEIDSTKTNALKLVKKSGSHKTRIYNFDKSIQKQVKDSLKKWLNLIE